MTNKEIAERLRKMVPKVDITMSTDDVHKYANGRYVNTEAVLELADTLDPPRSEPGAVVWWRGTFFGASKDWQLGEAEPNGIYAFGSENPMPWRDAEYKTARILAPDEVAIKVPPINKWKGFAELHIRTESPQGGVTFSDLIITRPEALRMEADR